MSIHVCFCLFTLICLTFIQTTQNAWVSETSQKYGVIEDLYFLFSAVGEAIWSILANTNTSNSTEWSDVMILMMIVGYVSSSLPISVMHISLGVGQRLEGIYNRI